MISMRSDARLASSPCSSNSSARSASASAAAPASAWLSAPSMPSSAILGPLHQGVDHLVFGHHLHHLTLHEQVALSRPAAMPRSASRASPGPFTTQPITATWIGSLHALQGGLGVVGDLDHIDLGPSARWAGDEVEALALAQPHGLEQDPTGTRLLHRIRGERVADGVADAFGQKRGDARGGLHQPGGRRPGLGDARGAADGR
jgi:hypothetical protein